jgi:hypothetical protein
LIEDFEKLLANAASGVAKVKVEKLHMIDGGDGRVLSSYIGAYPSMLASIFESVTQSTGIDIQRAISGRNTAPDDDKQGEVKA